MNRDIIDLCNQLLINQLTGDCNCRMIKSFAGHLAKGGYMHNALTAHGASTHPAFDDDGYLIAGRVVCIPSYPVPSWERDLPELFAFYELEESFKDSAEWGNEL